MVPSNCLTGMLYLVTIIGPLFAVVYHDRSGEHGSDLYGRKAFMLSVFFRNMAGVRVNVLCDVPKGTREYWMGRPCFVLG